MTKKKQPNFVYAVISSEDVLVGCFKDLQAIEDYLERNLIEEVTILTVTAVQDASIPPEPMLEFTDRNLTDLL